MRKCPVPVADRKLCPAFTDPKLSVLGAVQVKSPALDPAPLSCSEKPMPGAGDPATPMSVLVMPAAAAPVAAVIVPP